MAFDFQIFGDRQLKEEFVQWLTDERWPQNHSHFTRLWDYYQNPTTPITAASDLSESARTYTQAQEIGLPSRITGMTYSPDGGLETGRPLNDIRRKEVVIENDIAWRINTMVDFLFGKSVKFISRAADAHRRRDIEQILKAVFDANGGTGFYQDMAVLGCVYGFVDCLVRPSQPILSCLAGITPAAPHSLASISFQHVLHQASTIDLELIEAPRALPVLDENDYRNIRYYIQHFHQPQNDIARQDNFVMRLIRSKGALLRRQTVTVTEIIGADAWQRYENFD